MKIVDRDTFLTLPQGTLFAKFEPMIFGELLIKDEAVGTTGVCYEQDLISWFQGTTDSGAWWETLERAMKGEPTPPIDYNFPTKGEPFEEGQLFAVWEKHDVEALIARLQKALADAFA